MITEIFIVLLVIVIFLVFLGYYFNAPHLAISGFTILFLLGGIMLVGLFQYKTGEIQTTSYSYLTNSTTISSTNTTITNVYSTFSDEIILGVELSHIIGLILAVIGALGFVDVNTNLKGQKQ